MGGCICSNESCGLWISFHVDFFSCWCHGSQNFPVNPTDWTKFCVHHPCIYFLLIQYSFEDLLNLVQGSETEIKESLKKLQACQIEGKKKIYFFSGLSVHLLGRCHTLTTNHLESKHVPWKVSETIRLHFFIPRYLIYLSKFTKCLINSRNMKHVFIGMRVFYF